MISNTMCPYPYMHQLISSSGTVTPCCHVYEPPGTPWKKVNFRDGITTDLHKLMRKQMESGKWPGICVKCKDQEIRGDISHRQIALEQFGNTHNVKIKSLDVAYTNKCNLACRMCKPSDSSLLDELYIKAKEDGINEIPSWIKILGHTPTYEYEAIEKVKYTKKLIEEGLTNLKVTGGEPTACKHFMGLVEWILQNGHAKNIAIQITTNGTKLNKVLIKKLLQFKQVKLVLSIDGTGNVYNYVRHHGSWDKTYSNLQELSKHTSIAVSVACIASFFNTTNIIDLIYQCAELGIAVHVDQDLKPRNSEITPYNHDSNISSILLDQATQLRKDFKSWKSYSGEDTKMPVGFNTIIWYANKSAKTLENIANTPRPKGHIRDRLQQTIKIQDKLYNTNFEDFLQPEQIRYLGGNYVK